MAAVIHSLWANQDTGLMIMPGMVPLDDSLVRSEFTKFLGTPWSTIIDSEIDGQGSLAAQIDNENTALGAFGATRRVVRSLFLETSPLQSGNHPGVDERAIKVACTQPGEKPAVFGDAVGYLSGKSVHLYGENGRYWFSEQPTLRRVAEDRAAQLLDDRVALVVLPPRFSHTRGVADSEATGQAHRIFDSRGAQPRLNKNMIVFVASDTGRLDELTGTVARMPAWKSIVEQIDRGAAEMTGVTHGQTDAARSDLEAARNRVHALIPETYRWMLLPAQKSPMERPRIDERPITGNEPAGVRISKALTRKQWLMPVMDGLALRLELDQIPLWDGDHISVELLCQYFARHTYLPRVGSRETILDAIRNGVASLTWNPQTFAWAQSRIDAGGGGPAPGGIGRGPAVTPPDSSPVYTRYFGTVHLDPHRPSTQVGTILDEVIKYLTGTGADVRLTLDIEATRSAGFPDRERKIIEQNTVDLKFTDSTFEEE